MAGKVSVTSLLRFIHATIKVPIPLHLRHHISHIPHTITTHKHPHITYQLSNHIRSNSYSPNKTSLGPIYQPFSYAHGHPLRIKSPPINKPSGYKPRPKANLTRINSPLPPPSQDANHPAYKSAAPTARTPKRPITLPDTIAAPPVGGAVGVTVGRATPSVPFVADPPPPAPPVGLALPPPLPPVGPALPPPLLSFFTNTKLAHAILDLSEA